MVGGALNITAEQVLEFQAYGYLMERDGNRGPTAAPQNLYRTADRDAAGRLDVWVAIAVETDEQWRSLCSALGGPGWASPRRFDHTAGRREAHDEIDRHLGAWCMRRSTEEIVDVIWGAGVPIGAVLRPDETDTIPQLRSRGFFEPVTHPVTGSSLHIGYPVRFSGGPTKIHRRPAPTLGQHNHEVFVEVLGFSPKEVDDFERQGVIGTRLVGHHRTR
jgi:crotonobetainyl-CoA:carnitine CoA-transferase CaiB-like acyl-CoA transferase